MRHALFVQVTGYSGNIGDAFLYQDGATFSTYDRDNDPWRNSDHADNCALFNGGGFWYDQCSRASVNVVRGRGENFRWYNSPHSTATNLLLQSTRMWLLC